MYLASGIFFCFITVALAFGSFQDLNLAASEEEIDTLQEIFYNEQLKYMTTGNKSKTLQNIYESITVPKNLFRYEAKSIGQPYLNSMCLLCKTAVPTILKFRRVNKWSNEKIEEAAVDICSGFKIVPKHVCKGIIHANVDPLLYVVDNQPKMDAKVLCSVILQGSCGTIKDPEFDFEINVDSNRPPILRSKARVTKNKNTFKIIHVSDVHYDEQYTVGNNAVCEDPTCCRASQGLPENPKNAAGKWGAYTCDSPFEVIENVVNHIKTQHPDAEMIYYTGDTVDHGVWETSLHTNTEMMERVNQLFKSKFSSIPVIQVLGNHEGHPVNNFPPVEITEEHLSISHLYNYSATAWQHWLPKSTEATIKRGGYYTYLARPDFRIIVLNNNVCYILNWWLIYKYRAQAEQLQWLHDTLLQAEANREIVHILLHMPTGDASTYIPWAREYHKIIDRFHHIIAGQFNGHSHYDEFNVYYAREGNQQHAVNVAWNGGSTVTFTDKNPSYRVYHVNQDTYEVEEAVTWYFNLTEANLNPEADPKWKELFSFKSEFNLPDLSPKSLDQLVFHLARNKNDLRKFIDLRHCFADTEMENDCNNDCMLDKLCKIVTNIYGDDKKCKELKKIFNRSTI